MTNQEGVERGVSKAGGRGETERGCEGWTDVDELFSIEHLFGADWGVVCVEVFVAVFEDVEASSEQKRFQLIENGSEERS